jgi:hypothetical protein
MFQEDWRTWIAMNDGEGQDPSFTWLANVCFLTQRHSLTRHGHGHMRARLIASSSRDKPD